jgi:hypothetical protein
MNKKILHSLMALILVAFTLSVISCIPHIRGNGNVVKEERSVSNFEALDVSNGIEVLVTQDSIEKVVVETDSNIQKILRTKVSGGKLNIYLEEGVTHTRMLRVYVNLKQLKSVETGSGARVKSENKITGDKLRISSSSGSGVKMEVACDQLSAESSSGSNLKVWGSAKSLTADSSSGSGLDASGLVAENGKLSSSSGSHLEAQITKELKADASSGAGIKVSGNPPLRNTDSSSGGSVHFK